MITLSFFPLAITAIGPIIDFLIQKKVLGQYDKDGLLILGHNEEGQPVRGYVEGAQPKKAGRSNNNAKVADEEVLIKQAYGLEGGHSALQLPNEWVVSLLSVILGAAMASAIFVMYLGFAW